MILVWIIVIVAAGQVDVAYHEHRTQGIAARISGCLVAWGHKNGITFDDLYNTLGGYSSVLLAVVGMIVTGWINYSNRLEQKVYGFKRKELMPCALVITNLFTGVFCTPIGMMYALIHKYCFMAYFIMIMVFVQFLISNALLAATYNNKYDYDAFTKKMQKSLKKIRSMEDFCEYDGMLDQVADSIDGDTNWKELYQIFFEVMAGLEETEEHLKIHKAAHSFVSKVFAVQETRLLELLIQYTRKVNKNTRMNDKSKRIYWVLLDGLYQNCSEEQINDYLEQLFEEMVLDRNASNKEEYFRIDDVEDIFSMIALSTECWLQENDSRLEQFSSKLDRIVRLGMRQYVDNGQQLLLHLISERDVIMKGYSHLYYQCYYRLKKSFIADRKQIHMGSLTECIANIHI